MTSNMRYAVYHRSDLNDRFEPGEGAAPMACFANHMQADVWAKKNYGYLIDSHKLSYFDRIKTDNQRTAQDATTWLLTALQTLADRGVGKVRMTILIVPDEGEESEGDNVSAG